MSTNVLTRISGELAAYEALTEEQKAAADRPEAPDEPVLSDSFIQPVLGFGTC